MRILILTLAALLLSTNAFAYSCGPKLELNTTKDHNTNERTGYYNYDNNDNGYSIGLRLVIPLDNAGCDKVRADINKKKWEAKSKKVDVMQQKIQNLERIVKICKLNNELSICNDLSKLSAELRLQ